MAHHFLRRRQGDDLEPVGPDAELGDVSALVPAPSTETQGAAPRLRACRNAVLMPHRGGGTIETWAETADDTIANIQAALKGDRPPGLLPGF